MRTIYSAEEANARQKVRSREYYHRRYHNDDEFRENENKRTSEWIRANRKTHVGIGNNAVKIIYFD
jgi:hypothetical protein